MIFLTACYLMVINKLGIILITFKKSKPPFDIEKGFFKNTKLPFEVLQMHLRGLFCETSSIPLYTLQKAFFQNMP